MTNQDNDNRKRQPLTPHSDKRPTWKCSRGSNGRKLVRNLSVYGNSTCECMHVSHAITLTSIHAHHTCLLHVKVGLREDDGRVLVFSPHINNVRNVADPHGGVV